MPGRINREDIEALRERADVTTVIGEYTALKRSGSRLVGLCPFHSEKTPSLSVDAVQGLWNCFGCGAGGDVYGFLERIEALTFPEAVERLARMVGYELRYEELSPGQRRALGRRTRLSDLTGAAAHFYEGALQGPAGGEARDYLASRGLDEAGVRHFRIGWAPDEWDAATRHLLGMGFDAREIVDGGIAVEGRQGPMDRFRARVMFPILDHTGRDVVAFGGRVLPDAKPRTAPRDGHLAKYINSPETPLYRKSETLYALNWARAEIQRRDTALVVEGYMDVIGLHLAGVQHAVATCGTALTTEHFRRLEKFARRVILALDADDAGYAAADRARQLVEEAGTGEVGVLPLPAGEDPADLARRGADAVEQALGQTKTALEFQIEHLLRTAVVDTPEAQVEAYRRTFPLLARIGDRFLRFTYIRDVVAPAVRLSADRIEAELDRHLATSAAGDRGSPGGPEAQGDGAQPPPRGDGVTRLGGVLPAQPRDPQLLLERQVLQASLQVPELLPESWKHLAVEDFTAPVSRQLFEAIARAGSHRIDAVLAHLPDDDARARARALALSEATFGQEAGKVAELVARLRVSTVARQVAAMEERLAMVNPVTDPESYRAALADLTELERRRRDLLEGRQA